MLRSLVGSDLFKSGTGNDLYEVSDADDVIAETGGDSMRGGTGVERVYGGARGNVVIRIIGVHMPTTADFTLWHQQRTKVRSRVHWAMKKGLVAEALFSFSQGGAISLP